MKQLLAYQWMNPAGVIGGQDQAVQQESSVFGLLLQELLADPAVSQSGFGANRSSAASLPLYVRGAAGWPVTALSAGWLNSSLAGGLAGVSAMANTLAPSSEDDPLYGDTKASNAYDAFIAAAAAKYGVNAALIKGVIQTESGFDAYAVSPAGAKGLMQLMDDTARWLGVQNPWDPAQNIDGGTRYLSYLLRKYDGNVYSALAAYNAGPGRVDRLGLTSDELVRARYAELPDETRAYIPKVLQAALYWGLKV
jgi:soluble lytic murein transglycosylase-like protein